MLSASCSSRSASFLVLAAALAATITMAAPADIKPRAGGRSQVYTKCKNSGQFALTFDDGPYNYQGQIVDALDKHGATGTFFLNGNNYDCIYDKADELNDTFNAGHIIGSHTWSHADITKLSASQLNQELEKVEVALKKILGIKPKLFRPPYGNYDDDALEVLAQRGYSTIMWSMDSGDSTGHGPSYSRKQYEDQASRYPAPGIGLNHETYRTTADDVVPQAVEVLQEHGYKLVSVAECLGLEAYEYVGGKTNRDSSWHC